MWVSGAVRPLKWPLGVKWLNDNGSIFVKKNTERELCFDILYSFCLKYFSF